MRKQKQVQRKEVVIILMNENRARNVRLDYDVKDAYLAMKPVYKHFRKKNLTPPTEQKTHPSKNILRGAGSFITSITYIIVNMII